VSHLLISASELAQRLKAGHLCVFDVRHNLNDPYQGHREYQAAHIPGAHYLDHETQLVGPRTGKNGRHPLPTRQAFANVMREHGVTPETDIVIYDASGGIFSAHLWWMLRWLGHARQVLDGGWQAWQACGWVTQAITQPVCAPAAWVWPAPLANVVDAAAVEANIKHLAFTVLDARAANRYRGEAEPMDPVAGHIPGALNRPSTENLRDDGRFKSSETLKGEFDLLLAGRSPQNIVHQCGSGITACHNLLAMELAGARGSRLYAGSWSEWCADPARPVAKG
jgi:thiosulfate/3-mercaptopyruvate sulfurtransferase